MPTARTFGAAALAAIGFALVAPGALLASAGEAHAQPPVDASGVSGQPDLGSVRPFYYPGKKTTSPFELSDSPLAPPIVSMPAPTVIDGAGLGPPGGNADTPLSDGGDGSLAARRLTPYPLAGVNGPDLGSFVPYTNPAVLSEGADGTDFAPGADGAAGGARSGSGASTGGNTGTGTDTSKGGAGADGEPGSRNDSSED
jgi:hypothetical protein